MNPLIYGRRALANALVVLVLGSFVMATGASIANAVQPDEIMSDPKLEARAREISYGLRCLVCQNQSIDDSDAPLARDLRLLVRERLKSGDNNEQVVNYIVARYGDFVLLKPPFGWHTVLLWLAPFMVLIGAVFVARRSMQHPGNPSGNAGDGAALSADEKHRLDEVLASDGGDTVSPHSKKESNSDRQS